MGASGAWVGTVDRRLVHLDASTGTRLGSPLRLDHEPFSLAVGFGAVWVADGTRSVVRADEGSGKLEPIRVGKGPVDVAAGSDAVWVVNSTDGTVARFDPETRELGAVITVKPRVSAIALGAGAIWVTNPQTATLTRIDSSTRSTSSREVPVEPTDVAVGAGAVWVAGGDRLFRFSQRGSGPPASLRLDRSVDRIAVGDGAIWAVDTAGNRLTRIDPDDVGG